MFEREKRLESKNSKIDRQKRNIDRIAFFFGSVYLIGVLLWLASHKQEYLPSSPNSVNGKVSLDTKIANSDAEFIDRMQQELASIDRKAALENQTNSTSQSNLDATLSSLPASGNGFLKDAPQQDLLPLSIPLPPPPSTAITLPPSKQAIDPLPSNPELPARSDPNGTIVKAPSPSLKPISHTLVGLLELNDRLRAALVTVDGVTQRVYIGETIGESGWVLTSIANQKAGIQNKRETRSISVGENF